MTEVKNKKFISILCVCITAILTLMILATGNECYAASKPKVKSLKIKKVEMSDKYKVTWKGNAKKYRVKVGKKKITTRKKKVVVTVKRTKKNSKIYAKVTPIRGKVKGKTQKVMATNGPKENVAKVIVREESLKTKRVNVGEGLYKDYPIAELIKSKTIYKGNTVRLDSVVNPKSEEAELIVDPSAYYEKQGKSLSEGKPISKKVKWYSSNKKIATVKNVNGNRNYGVEITAKKAGKCKVIAKAHNGVVGTVTITVKNVPEKIANGLKVKLTERGLAFTGITLEAQFWYTTKADTAQLWGKLDGTSKWLLIGERAIEDCRMGTDKGPRTSKICKFNGSVKKSGYYTIKMRFTKDGVPGPFTKERRITDEVPGADVYEGLH